METAKMPHMGCKLAERLGELNMSQTDLAAKIKCSRQAVSALIQAAAWHSKTLHKISRVVRVPVNYFFES